MPTIQSGGKIQIVVENGIRRAGTLDLEVAEPLTGVFATVTLHPAAVKINFYFLTFFHCNKEFRTERYTAVQNYSNLSDL
jgi:hypothetical protein